MVDRNPPPVGDEGPVHVLLGTLPPPVTGASANTALVLEDMKAKGLDPVAINTTTASGTALDRSISYHFHRIRRFLSSAARLRSATRKRGAARLYIVPDGGLGLWYTVGYARAARSRFQRVVMHHHTFQYIRTPSRAMRIVCALLNGKLTHVFLSEGMKQKFFGVYGEQPAIVSTNARFVEPRTPHKPDDRLVIGHLSNLSAAKGFFEVADCFEMLRARGLPVELQLAGPVVESQVQARLDELLAAFGDAVQYHGPVYGDAKSRFYDRLHVFLFPTRWAQEAQPNVIFEAFAGGGAVVANDLGVIGEMIEGGVGKLVASPDRFVGDAADYCQDVWERRGEMPDRTGLIAKKMQHLCALSRKQGEDLLELLMD